jgi:hypothetical protein
LLYLQHLQPPFTGVEHQPLLILRLLRVLQQPLVLWLSSLLHSTSLLLLWLVSPVPLSGITVPYLGQLYPPLAMPVVISR